MPAADRPQLDPDWSVADVAKALKCSRALVYKLIDSGDLDAYQLGTGRPKLRVSQDAIRRYRDSHRRPIQPVRLRIVRGA